MSHQNFILPTSGVGHVVTLLLRGYEVLGGDCHYKKGGGLRERLRLQKILTWKDSNLVHYLSQPARKQLMLMNSFFSQYLISLSGSA